MALLRILEVPLCASLVAVTQSHLALILCAKITFPPHPHDWSAENIEGQAVSQSARHLKKGDYGQDARFASLLVVVLEDSKGDRNTGIRADRWMATKHNLIVPDMDKEKQN